MSGPSVVIVGASIAGVATAEGLRRKGFAGPVTLVDTEPHLPYDKPPLSKEALTRTWDHGQLQLRTAEHYRDLDLTLRLGVRVTGLDSQRHVVTLADGGELHGDHIVIATGGRPRGFHRTPPGVFTLRGREDAQALRVALTRSRHLTVVGGGFVGAEVAATARQAGLEVTVVEVAPLPFLGLLGRPVAEALARVHRRRGVQVQCSTRVTSVVAGPTGPQLLLDDGRTLSSDVVVVGLGTVPNVEWLAGSGVEVGDGVHCDARGATSTPKIWAVGDVAAWPDPMTACRQRGHHWTGARTQGDVVAHAIATAERPSISHESPLREPSQGAAYFWSDLYDLRLQCYGDPGGHDHSEVVWGALDDERYVVTYHRDGVLVAVLGVNAARELRSHRLELERQLRRVAKDPSPVQV